MEKIRAETTSSISQIEMEEKILLKEGKQKVETIESRFSDNPLTILDEINLEKQKTIAEVDNCN